MTHLGTSVDRLANLVTMQLNNNNTAQPFFFDRQAAAPFNIPTGYCFIITDVFVIPQVTNFAANQFYLVVITADGGRSIELRCDGRTRHLALTDGLVVPGPKTPSPGGKGLGARNTTFSSGPVEVQVLGYFEKEAIGPAVGLPFAP